MYKYVQAHWMLKKNASAKYSVLLITKDPHNLKLNIIGLTSSDFVM